MHDFRRNVPFRMVNWVSVYRTVTKGSTGEKSFKTDIKIQNIRTFKLNKYTSMHLFTEQLFIQLQTKILRPPKLCYSFFVR